VSIAPARPSDALSADLERTRRTRAQVEALIADPALLGPDFSPIRRLDSTAPGMAPLLGWKATGRGAPGSGIADTLTLLEQAAALGLVERLDWAFRAHTFETALDAGVTGELHLTPEPETFGSVCPPRLAVPVLRGRRALSVCAELHADAFSADRLLAAADEMRSWGWQLVYADLLGSPAADAALRLASRLRPAYMQIDLALPGRANGPALAAWVDVAAQVGAQVMVLGVDTQAALDRGIALGATYGRGSLVGRPSTRPV
jgi:EAL domain-containing protein (putative c-di-GMP-specific phosphodiesterase class I)